jgi:hypothetical protein
MHVWYRLAIGAKVGLTERGPRYTPTGPDDPIALFLLSRDAIPAPNVAGTPPTCPIPRLAGLNALEPIIAVAPPGDGTGCHRASHTDRAHRRAHR